MLPSRKEMMDYWFEHPIAGSLIAFGMIEGIKTVWESAVNPKGRSPFSTYDDVRSGYIVDDLGHLSSSQKEELEEVTKGLKAASKMHAGQAKTIEQLGHSYKPLEPGVLETFESIKHANEHHTMHYNNHKAPTFGSSSTTTSTSSAHGGTQRTNAGSTWDKQKMPGERAEMFGGPKRKGGVLMGPPSMRRRISLNSITLGGLSKAPQELSQGEEVLPTSEHFGMINMLPEQSEDATDNPWV